MIYFVILCLFVALSAYLLLGGADFGAGILEIFTSPGKRVQLQHITYRAIGPIWEVNHIWLILALVILFVGFPSLHRMLVVNLHIPLTVLLLGIVFRGTAFVFRHYDAYKDGSQKIYDRIFEYSSVFSVLFLGIIAGAVLSGEIDPNAQNFHAAYLAPWLNGFAFSIGLFTVFICSFLAAAYLIGEDGEENHIVRFVKKAQIANLGVVLSGGLALLFAPKGFRTAFLGGPGIWGMGIAGLGVVLFWMVMKRKQFITGRLVAGGQVLAILASAGLTLEETLPGEGGILGLAAGPGTINTLGYTLIAGLLLILPAIYLLFKTFNVKSE